MKPYRSPQKLPPQIAEHRRKQSRARSAVMELRFQGRLTQAGPPLLLPAWQQGLGYFLQRNVRPLCGCHTVQGPLSTLGNCKMTPLPGNVSFAHSIATIRSMPAHSPPLNTGCAHCANILTGQHCRDKAERWGNLGRQPAPARRAER